MQETINKLDSLSESLQRNPEYNTLKEFSRGLIDLAKTVWELDSEAKRLKLDYDIQFNARVKELSEDMAVNKSQAQALWELKDKKESYKQAESNYEKAKLLNNAYRDFLITARQELKSQEQHNITVNEFSRDEYAKEHQDMPF